MENNSIYTEEELAILGKVKDLRLNIMDAMTKDGIPYKSGDIRVLNEVMTGAESMVVNSANTRLKREDTDNNGAAVELVAEMLMSARRNKLKYTEEGSLPSVKPGLENIETVPGEADIAQPKLDPTEFVSPTFDPEQAGE